MQKNTQYLLILITLFASIAFYNNTTNSSQIQIQASASLNQLQNIYNNWLIKYSKQYKLLGEKSYRKQIWFINYQYVKQHNRRYHNGDETYDLEMNNFADLTQKQFAEIYLMKDYENNKEKRTNTNTITNKCNGAQPPQANLPQSIDWAAKGGVTYIKDQGQCGSCWAFSTTGALQGLKYKKDGSLSAFSEQQLMDCSTSYQNNGCSGGFMQNSFYYVIDHGITTQTKYPYKALTSTCHYQQQTDKVYQIHDCTVITTHKQKSLMASIAQQPTSIAIQANHLSFQLYKSGVYNGNCGTKLDHGVLAVGYGTLDGKSYYKVKNSWGSRWGMQGYIYIIRNGDGKGKCGILLQPSIPIA